MHDEKKASVFHQSNLITKVLGIFIWVGGFSRLFSEVTLPPLFADHAILQKSEKTAIWGKANPGETISVTLDSLKGETVAGNDGKWRVELNLSTLGQGPYDLSVKGTNTVTIKDVLLGELWLASGQSNMVWWLKSTNGAAEEIQSSANPQIRVFSFVNVASPVPKEDFQGTWKVAGPQTTGDFSATGYYFAKKLQQTLQCPVGIITAAWGGTAIEAWISRDAIKTNADLDAGAAKIEQEIAAYDGLKKSYVEAHSEWEKKYQREDKPFDAGLFAGSNIDTSDWKKVTLPGKFSEAGLPLSGAIWIRRKVTISAYQAKNPQPLLLPPFDGFESVYLNGKLIQKMTPEKFRGQGVQRLTSLPVGIEGENTIAVRLYCPKSNIGLVGTAGQLKWGSAALNGEWLAKAEYEFPPLAQEAVDAYPNPPKMAPYASNSPAYIYQGIIHPMVGHTIKGVIWYQGEANVTRAYQYQTTFTMLIQNWRNKWGTELPFYFCQLANNQPKTNQPKESMWAELRAAQHQALSLPQTGEAVIIDLGEADDIHPWNKKDVGERLARIALTKSYQKEGICMGPIYDSFQIEENKIRIQFKQPSGGLVAQVLPQDYILSSEKNLRQPLIRNSPTSELEGFAICDAARKWVWANAKIEGESVIVWADSVAKPVAVRYAWSENPTCNLYNKEGLPASPFKTDDFAWMTEKNKY